MADTQPNYNKGYYVEGPYLKYEYAEVTVSGGVSDFDVKSSTNFFENLVQGKYLEVSSSGADVSMKMNSSSNSAIPVADGAAPWAVMDFLFTNLYFTNSTGSNATVTLYMMGHR